MANEGVDWALSFADGAERADDGPDVNAQAPGPASTQRAGAKEKASQEPKTVRPRTQPVPACIHPRSRVFSHTTRPSPRTRAVSTTHPPRSPRCRHRPLFLARGSHSRLFPRRGGVPEPKNSPLTASLRTLPIVPQCRVKGCGATCHTVHEVRARACASHCAALYVQLDDQPEGTQSRFCYQCHKFHTMDEYVTPDGSLLQRHNCYKSQQRRLHRRRDKSKEKAAASKTNGGRGRGRNQPNQPGANPTAYFLSRAAGVQARRVAGADGASQSRGGAGGTGAGGTAPVAPSPLYATQKSGDMPPPPPRRPSGGVLIEPVTYANYEEPVAKTYQELLPSAMQAAEASGAGAAGSAMNTNPGGEGGGAGGGAEMTEETMRRLRNEAVRAHNAQTLRFGSFTESSLKPRTAPSVNPA